MAEKTALAIHKVVKLALMFEKSCQAIQAIADSYLTNGCFI
jgi:hypothetical protein